MSVYPHATAAESAVKTEGCVAADSYLGAHDARAAANLLLNTADAYKQAVSAWSLNSLLWFVNGLWLTQFSKPLLRQRFRAAPAGPVLTVVMKELHSLRRGAQNGAPVTERIAFTDFTTGRTGRFTALLPAGEEEFFLNAAGFYLRFTDRALARLAQDEAWNKALRSTTGRIITDDMIISSFSVGARHMSGRC